MQIRFNFTAVSIGNTRCMQMRRSVRRPPTHLRTHIYPAVRISLLSILIQLGRAQKAGQTKPRPGVNCGPNAQCGNNSTGALFNAVRPMLRHTRSERERDRELGAHLKCTPSISGALFSRLFRSASISRALSQNIKCPLCWEMCSTSICGDGGGGGRPRNKKKAHFLLSAPSLSFQLCCVCVCAIWLLRKTLPLETRARVAQRRWARRPCNCCCGCGQKTMPARTAFITRCRPHFLIIITADHFNRRRWEVVREWACGKNNSYLR